MCGSIALEKSNLDVWKYMYSGGAYSQKLNREKFHEDRFAKVLVRLMEINHERYKYLQKFEIKELVRSFVQLHSPKMKLPVVLSD